MFVYVCACVEMWLLDELCVSWFVLYRLQFRCDICESIRCECTTNITPSIWLYNVYTIHIQHTNSLWLILFCWWNSTHSIKSALNVSPLCFLYTLSNAISSDFIRFALIFFAPFTSPYLCISIKSNGDERVEKTKRKKITIVLKCERKRGSVKLL